MRFSVAIECVEHLTQPGWVDADKPVRMSEPVAFLDVDTGGKSYNATINGSAFRRVIGPSFGQARPDLSILGVNIGQDLVLANIDQPVLVLNYFFEHPLLRNYGAAFWKFDSKANRWFAWTYYRSILHPATMTPSQRTEAMLQIVSDDLFWQELGSQAADFIDPKGLAIMAGIMALCASNPIGWFAAVLAVVLGVNGILIDWMKLAPEWQKFQAYRNYSKDENDLREGAKSIAIILTTIIMEILTMKVMDAAGRVIPIEKLKEVFFKKTRGDWEQAGNQVKAANNGAEPPLPKPKAEPEATGTSKPGKTTTEVAVEVAVATAPKTKAIGNGYIFKTSSTAKFLTEEVSGDLIKPSQLPKTPRNNTELRKLSKGTGEHAGHRIAHRFGGPDCRENLGLQNPNMNTYSPKAVRDEFYCREGGGTYLQFEDELARLLEEGWKIHLTVKDKYRLGESRPAYREVDVIATPPHGEKITKNFSFGNFGSPQSRGEFIPRTKKTK